MRRAFVASRDTKSRSSARYGDIEKFENEMRDKIAQEKLRAFVTRASTFPTRKSKKNTNAATHRSTLVTSLYGRQAREKIQPSDDECVAYYESHKTDYRYLEPQRKVRYVFIDTEKVGSKLQIPDAE